MTDFSNLRALRGHTHLASKPTRFDLASKPTRFATDRLASLAQSKGSIDHSVPEVLFVCEQNAGRSQMDAVLTNLL